jgi:hypothetical protein
MRLITIAGVPVQREWILIVDLGLRCACAAVPAEMGL